MNFPSCPDCGSSEDGAEVFACDNADCDHHEGNFCGKCAKAVDSNSGKCPYCDEYGAKVGEVVSDQALSTEHDEEDDDRD